MTDNSRIRVETRDSFQGDGLEWELVATPHEDPDNFQPSIKIIDLAMDDVVEHPDADTAFDAVWEEAAFLIRLAEDREQTAKELSHSAKDLRAKVKVLDELRGKIGAYL